MDKKYMSLLKRIRAARTEQHLTQEDMAGKLEISSAGYAKIERGETQLSLVRLDQIVNILNLDALELLSQVFESEGRGNYFSGENHGDNRMNYYESSQAVNEIEKLNIIIEGQKAMIEEKENQIQTLRKMIELLETNN